MRHFFYGYKSQNEEVCAASSWATQSTLDTHGHCALHSIMTLLTLDRDNTELSQHHDIINITQGEHEGGVTRGSVKCQEAAVVTRGSHSHPRHSGLAITRLAVVTRVLSAP